MKPNGVLGYKKKTINNHIGESMNDTTIIMNRLKLSRIY